jgi:hypothetical protein
VDLARGRAERAGADTELLDSIRSEAKRIDGIVRGLLDYARARETEPEPRPVGPVLERVRDLLESQGRLVLVEHEWTQTEPEAPDVLMDPHRLEQVIVNLLLNSLHAVGSAERPRIRVMHFGEIGRLGRLPVRREGDPPEVNYRHRRRVAGDPQRDGPSALFTAERVAVIRVEDNGPGIPEEHLEQIFDPFFTTKAPGEGTGLGLAICARLVEGMGGRITAGNGDEGGAVFTVRLPGVSVEEPRAPAAERPRAGEAREAGRSLGGVP